MNLPSYDRNNRYKAFEQLPKGAYVIKIVSAKEDTWPSGDQCLRIAFDIAEGKYASFYQKMFDNNHDEDKKWPFDAQYTLNVPNDGSEEYKWRQWNSFFADLEDSNNGFVFKGDLKTLKGKVIGGLFRIKQTQKDGKVYNHTELRWTKIADDVRAGTFGRLPEDKLIAGASIPAEQADSDGFMKIPEGTGEEFPF